MKNCEYQYQIKDDLVISSKSLITLRSKVLNNLESAHLRADFKFYHSSISSEIQDKLEKAKQEFTNNTKNLLRPVTRISKNIVDLLYKRESSYNPFSQSNEFIFSQNFSRKFGTLFHEYIELYLNKDYSKLQEIYENIKLLISAKLDEINQGKLNSALYEQNELVGISNYDIQPNNIKIKNQLELIRDWIGLNNSGKPDEFIGMINDAVNKFLLQTGLNGTRIYHKSELPIIGGRDSSKIDGRIDLITFNENGDVNIYDFKTTFSDSKVRNVYNYIQLKLYEELLKEHEVSENINSANIIFNFSKDDGIVVTINKSNNSISLSSEERARIKSEILKIFPEKGKIIPDKEKIEKRDKIKKIHQSLFSQKYLNKIEKEGIKQYIEDSYNKKSKYRTKKQNKESTVEKNGDIYILKDNNNNILYLGTLDQIVEEEFKEAQQLKENIIYDYVTAITDKNKESLQSLIRNSGFKQQLLYSNLYKYLSYDWTYVSNPMLENNFGIITMKNIRGTYDFILLVDNTMLQKITSTNNKYNHLLSMFFDNKVLDKYDLDIFPESSIQNVELFKLLIAISEYSDYYPEDMKIGDIKIVSTSNGTGSYVLNFDKFRNALKVLLIESQKPENKIENKILYADIYDKFIKLNFNTIEERLEQNIIDCLRILEVEESINNKLSNNFSTKSLQQKINELTELLTNIRMLFKDLFSVNRDLLQHITTVQKLDTVISLYLNQLQGLLSDDILQTTTHSITISSTLGSLSDLVRYGKTKKVDLAGVAINGFLQGLETTNSYNNPDETIRRYNLVINAYRTKMNNQYIKEIEEVNKATDKYLTYIQKGKLFGRFGDRLIGKHNEDYSELFLKDENGDIDKKFQYINPYLSNNLAEYQNEYLEVILWNTNKRRIPNNDLNEDIKELTYEELKRNKTAFDKYKAIVNNNSKYLDIPIMMGSTSKYIALTIFNFAKGKYNSRFWKDLLERTKYTFDSRGFSESQRKEELDKIKALLAFNMFNEDEHARASRLDNHSVESFEWNVNFITNSFIYQDINYKVNTELLQITDRFLQIFKEIELTTGIDLSNQILNILDRARVSIYGRNLYKEEHQDAMGIIGTLKGVTSLAKIALRPGLFVKEMLVGFIKNYSIAATRYGLNITEKDLTKAYGIIFGEFSDTQVGKILGSNSMNDFSLAELLNNEYRITNRDINVLPDKLTTDRYGLYNTTNRKLFSNVTSPDWPNRMSLFVSKMLADGCFYAHSKNKDGQLVYDMAKDERFKEFWEHRYDKNYSTESFLYQKAMYLKMMKEFAKFGYKNSDGTTLRYGVDENGLLHYDKLPAAYTPKQRDNIKEIVGTLYGFYDHEEKTITEYKTWWGMLTQFSTYLPATLKLNFALDNPSSTGMYELMKDKTTGELLYEYIDPHTGEIILTTEKETNGVKNLPAIEWIAHPLKGMAMATIQTLRDVVLGKFSHLRDNPDEYRIAILGLVYLLIGLMLANTFKAIFFGSDVKEKDLSKFDKQLYSTVQKVSNDFYFYESVVKPIYDFNIAGTSFFVDTGNDLIKAFSGGDYKIINAFYDNILVLKDTNLLEEK